MKQNNLIKNLSLKAIGGIVFGIAAIIGIAMTLAFTEPTSGPTPGFSEPMTTDDKGDWVAYGRGWSPNSGYTAPCDGGDSAGSCPLTAAACAAAYLADTYYWKWFEDGNGDGDTTDEEDGICVLMCTGATCSDANTASGTNSYSNSGILSANWGGTETLDNTYIAEYTCSGNFPSGVVVPGASYPPAGTCALCVADCYDGKKDLPNQGTYTAPDTTCDASFELCYEGPITPEVLKNWKGTRLPTSNDFFGFCGNGTATVATGRYGTQVGRTDEYVNTADDGIYEWLSEQLSYYPARVAGFSACSYFDATVVADDGRFRAVFRP